MIGRTDNARMEDVYKRQFRDTCKLPLPLTLNWVVPVARTKYGDNGVYPKDVYKSQTLYSR